MQFRNRAAGVSGPPIGGRHQLGRAERIGRVTEAGQIGHLGG